MQPLVIPLLMGAAASGACWFWDVYPSFKEESTLSAFGGSVASISSTMLGFLLAALAVLASISHTHLLKVMREQGYYRDLLDTMLIGFLLFLLCAISGFGLLFGVQLTPKIGFVLVGLHTAAVISLLDIGRKLWLVLRNLK
jgi:hypothetical protein